MNQEISLIKAIQIQLQLYANKDYERAFSWSKQLIQHAPDELVGYYVQSLCLYQLGKRVLAAKLMSEIELKCPAIKRYDLMRPIILRQRGNDWLAIHENRLAEIEKFKQVDSFILSYPKSGRTWLRLLISAYLLGSLTETDADPMDVFSLTLKNQRLPTIEFTHDDYPMWKPLTEIIHDKSVYRDKSVVLLVRDPRDVMVSYYFQFTKRGDAKLAMNSDFDGTLFDFVKHNIGGLATLIEFMNIWAQQRLVVKSFLLIQYEDLMNDTESELTRLFEFLEIEIEASDRLQQAVQMCEFEKMKKMEVENTLSNRRLSTTAQHDPESYKVRRGKVGGYRDYFSAAEINWINTYIYANLDPFYQCYRDV